VPLLQSLNITIARLTSLRCFAKTPHLAHTLQWLCLWAGSGCIPVSELAHLQPLRALRHLRLLCLASSLPTDDLAQLTPGNPQFAARYWPKLEFVGLSA